VPKRIENTAVFRYRGIGLVGVDMLLLRPREAYPTKFSVRVTCGRGLVLLWQQCNVLPVLWMPSCFVT